MGFMNRCLQAASEATTQTQKKKKTIV